MKKRLLTVVCAGFLGAVALAGPSAARADHSSGDGSAGCNDGTVKWDPTTLWPPNHRMQDITIKYDDGDNDNVRLTVDLVTHDQFLEDGTEMVGSGNPHLTDTEGTGATDTASGDEAAEVHVGVRSERSGQDQTGRTYSITVTCQDYTSEPIPDPSGTDSTGAPNPDGAETVTLTVLVPHDQGNHYGQQ